MVEAELEVVFTATAWGTCPTTWRAVGLLAQAERTSAGIITQMSENLALFIFMSPLFIEGIHYCLRN
jgi:hypothetical protein